jgi:ribosomal protein L35AE/L33A
LAAPEVARRQESPYVDGQVAFRRPTAASGSVVFTRASEHNGEVTSATVVRIRFATGQPPQVLDVRTTPALREREGCRLSAAGVW